MAVLSCSDPILTNTSKTAARMTNKDKAVMRDINVAKFGGTSMANYDTMRKCAEVVCQNAQTRVVVVSACAGVTNMLVEFGAGSISITEQLALAAKIDVITQDIVKQLADSSKVSEQVVSIMAELRAYATGVMKYSLAEQDDILSVGERLSSTVFAQVVKESGMPSYWFDIREVMMTDSGHSQAKPQLAEIRNLAQQHLLPLTGEYIVVSQGFIGRDAQGHTTTLGRGGSDYTAALIAEAMQAATCEIWTDVKGVYTTDPRIVSAAKPIPELSFEEAAEMANFGAKVLHPATMIPAIRSGVRVFVGSSFDSEAGGTWLVQDCTEEPYFRAISLRRHQVLVTFKSKELFSRSTYLSEVFGLFGELDWKLDLVTISETSIAISVDTGAWATHGGYISSKLQQLVHIEVSDGYGLVTIVGNKMHSGPGVMDTIFAGMQDIPLRMVCYGANPHNISLLVESQYGDAAVVSLHQHLFEKD